MMLVAPGRRRVRTLRLWGQAGGKAGGLLTVVSLSMPIFARGKDEHAATLIIIRREITLLAWIARGPRVRVVNRSSRPPARRYVSPGYTVRSPRTRRTPAAMLASFRTATCRAVCEKPQSGVM